MFIVIPDAMEHLTDAEQVSRTPMWLTDANPLANHPWSDDPDASLPSDVETLVIGAGFTGAAAAYHWAKAAPEDRKLLVVEMDDPASGSSGRNEGLVVMGRYFMMVRDTVAPYLARVRADLPEDDRLQLASQFARRYCRAAYRNADLIEQTIEREQFQCDYQRAGWVQARAADGQASLAESVRLACQHDCRDWTSIPPEEVLERSGMRVDQPAGFSVAAASWHPAKWVWSLLQSALARPHVQLATRTAVQSVQGSERGYVVETSHGTVRAQHVLFATESYTPRLLARFHDAILPMQEQAASGDGGPETMRPHVGISGNWFFAGRYGRRVLFGSGGSRVRDDEAGRNEPSRFLTRFVAGELLRHFGPYELTMTNEWSGTVGYTPDEYPVVGSIDGHGQWIIGGMCGSGSGVSFNAARCIVERILAGEAEPTAPEDDYPPEYFAPSRLLDPQNHPWPAVER